MSATRPRIARRSGPTYDRFLRLGRWHGVIVFEKAEGGRLARRGHCARRQRVLMVRHFQRIEQRFQPVGHVAALGNDVSGRFGAEQGDSESGHHAGPRTHYRNEREVAHRADDQDPVVVFGLKEIAMAV